MQFPYSILFPISRLQRKFWFSISLVQSCWICLVDSVLSKKHVSWCWDFHGAECFSCSSIAPLPCTGWDRSRAAIEADPGRLGKLRCLCQNFVYGNWEDSEGWVCAWWSVCKKMARAEEFGRILGTLIKPSYVRHTKLTNSYYIVTWCAHRCERRRETKFVLPQGCKRTLWVCHGNPFSRMLNALFFENVFLDLIWI